MKKITINLLLLVAMCGSSGLSAQVFWSEDFQGGTFPTGWTTTDGSGQGALWKWTKTPSDAVDLYNQPAPTTTTVANGLMYMNSDSVLTADGVPGDLPTSHLARLTSPAINCASKPKVFLISENYIGEFNAASQARIRVSTDGTNWTAFDYPAYNDPSDVRFSDNPFKPIVDISSVAANQAQVFVQWEWQGNWDYWWFLDDVKLTTIDPNPANNLRISSFFYPLSHYQTPVFAIEKDTFGFSCNVNNVGSATQTQMVVKAWVYDELNNDILFTDSIITQGLEKGVDSMFFFTKRFAPKLAVGLYSVHYSCYVPNSADAVPSDNTKAFDFEVSEGDWALEKGVSVGFQPANVSEDWAVGSMFYMLGGNNDNYQITNVEFQAGGAPGIMNGRTAQIYIFQINDDLVQPNWNGFDDAMFFSPSLTWIGEKAVEYLDSTSADYPIMNVEVNSFPNGDFGVQINQGKRYMVVCAWEGPNIDVFHAYSQEIPYSQFSVNSTVFSGGWSLLGFSGKPTAYLRATTSLVSIIDEVKLTTEVSEIYPNPSSENVSVDLKFTEPTDITITIADINGRVISVIDKEKVGNETYTFNSQSLQSGNYILRVSSKIGTKTSKFVIAR